MARKIHRPHRRIAVIFDFDETLTDDSTSVLLASHGVDVEEFWDVKVPRLIKKGFDPTEAYLMLLIKEMRSRGKLEELKDAKLRRFGGTLEFHPGVKELFRELRQLVGERKTIQFFVISGGLQEVIAGSSIRRELDDFWGCTYYWDNDFKAPFPKSVISLTEKTKYLFQINKGIFGEEFRNKPYEVNKYMHPGKRKIPFTNMIYIGDGLTDVPCFSILDEYQGQPICVFNESRGSRAGIQRSIEKSLERAVEITRHRGVRGPYKAVYRAGSGLREFLDPLIEHSIGN